MKMMKDRKEVSICRLSQKDAGEIGLFALRLGLQKIRECFSGKVCESLMNAHNAFLTNNYAIVARSADEKIIALLWVPRSPKDFKRIAYHSLEFLEDPGYCRRGLFRRMIALLKELLQESGVVVMILEVDISRIEDHFLRSTAEFVLRRNGFLRDDAGICQLHFRCLENADPVGYGRECEERRGFRIIRSRGRV